MSSSPQLLNRRWGEIVFSLITGGIGIATIKGGLEMDIGWTSSGPDAGYFPFRVGVVILCASLVNLVQQGILRPAEGPYVSRQDFRAMALFFVPLVVLAVISLWLGLYIAITLYLLFALGVIGRIAWHRTILISLSCALFLYGIFEFIFHLPLPKGPLGPLLGVL